MGWAATFTVATALMVFPSPTDSTLWTVIFLFIIFFVLQPPMDLSYYILKSALNPCSSLHRMSDCDQGLASVWPWRKSGLRQQASPAPKAWLTNDLKFLHQVTGCHHHHHHHYHTTYSLAVPALTQSQFNTDTLSSSPLHLPYRVTTYIFVVP